MATIVYAGPIPEDTSREAEVIGDFEVVLAKIQYAKQGRRFATLTLADGRSVAVNPDHIEAVAP